RGHAAADGPPLHRRARPRARGHAALRPPALRPLGVALPRGHAGQGGLRPADRAAARAGSAGVLAGWTASVLDFCGGKPPGTPPVVLLVVVVAARGQWADSYRLQKRMSNEARVFSMIGPGDVLWLPATPPATLPELARLTGSPARWTYDALPLCAGRLAAQRF